MYTYRGAYLNALAEAFHAGLRPESVYLWTLPMFHCNGWCFPWAVSAAGATHVCLRKADAAGINGGIHDEGVTHFCAAPTVLIGAAQRSRRRGPFRAGSSSRPPARRRPRRRSRRSKRWAPSCTTSTA